MSKILIHVDTPSSSVDATMPTEATIPLQDPQTSQSQGSQSSAFWYAQGDALAQQDRYAEALTKFDQAIALQPNYQEALVFRGVVLIHLGRYQEALESCDRAIAICPNHTEAWIFRGAALHQLGDYRAAYISYEHALGDTHSSPIRNVLNWVRQTWVGLHSSGQNSPS
jgi:tetratricopeptide (TPR) repeat protein